MGLVSLIIIAVLVLGVAGLGLLYVAGKSDDRKSIVNRARELGEDERPGC